jgi:predicted benzoate:H+ symporter BenE
MRDKQLTWEQYWKLMFGVACVVILVMASGCVSPRPMTFIPSTNGKPAVILAEQAEIQQYYDSHPGAKNRWVAGFYDPNINIIFCMYGAGMLPDMATFGEESYHAYVGQFHEP